MLNGWPLISCGISSEDEKYKRVGARIMYAYRGNVHSTARNSQLAHQMRKMNTKMLITHSECGRYRWTSEFD